jgi:hypothetical protein
MAARDGARERRRTRSLEERKKVANESGLGLIKDR